MRVGVFDSGFGGLSIYRSIRQRLPLYDFVYLGDNARTPYGNRSFEAILKFTTEGVAYLFSQDCQLIIIACNTASAKALRSIQQKILPFRYPEKRVLGIIRPSVEEIGRDTTSKTVALWATEGTVKSMSFAMELEKFAPGVRLIQQACPMLVPLVEAGEFEGPAVEYFVRKYWEATIHQGSGIDVLLLACTHYPLLKQKIEQYLPKQVKLLSQGEIVADSLRDYLNRHPEIEKEISKNSDRKLV